MAPIDGIDADQLLKKADMALYAAKNSGGGNHCFFAGEMEEAVQARRALELDLREALAYAFDFEWANKNLMFDSYARTHSCFQNSDMMAKGKALAVWSLVLWGGVVTSGRMLAYTYNYLKYNFRG